MRLSQWLPLKFARGHVEGAPPPPEVPPPSPEVPPPPASASPPSSVVPPPAVWSMEPLRALQHFLNETHLADPFSGFESLNRWVEDHSPTRFHPRVDVVDRGSALEISAELPGMTREDVKLSITEDALVLSGEKRSDSSFGEHGSSRVERAHGLFSRSIPLPSGVDRERVEATFANGVLTVTLPKTAASQTSRSVPIN